MQKTVKSELNYRHLERDLGLFEDEDGVLRCDGRISNAEISEEAKFSALVPKNCASVEQFEVVIKGYIIVRCPLL